ncbi:hypothetical protein [Sporolactobacillus nakayamae]|uniref:hypothetical protein n=1 Tax=Sporolactobacillus nakayamae TaxID=269670 RepID=UPI0015A6DFF2|nr:hypothetical protein [Sporolactobacillus nakayamae]
MSDRRCERTSYKVNREKKRVGGATSPALFFTRMAEDHRSYPISEQYTENAQQGTQ